MWRPTGTEAEKQSNYFLKRAFRCGGLDMSLKNVCVEREQQSRQRQGARGVISESWTGIKVWSMGLEPELLHEGDVRFRYRWVVPFKRVAPAQINTVNRTPESRSEGFLGVTLWRKIWNSEEL